MRRPGRSGASGTRRPSIARACRRPTAWARSGASDGRQTTVEEVVAFEPPADGHARFAYELRSGLPLRDYHSEVTLETVGGGTRIRWVSTFDGAYPVVGAVVRLALARFIPDTARRLARVRRNRPVTVDGPLAGVRVVDLTRARAGPTCVRQLTDLGAEAIAVQSPAGGGVFSSLGSDGANLHRNKRAIAVDLTTDDGRAVFFRLVERADVVVENFRPGVKYRLGIEPDAVWAVNPRVVYASISGFGQTGPYASRPGASTRSRRGSAA